MKRVNLWMVALAAVIGFGLGAEARGGAVYWTSAGQVWKANLEGSGAKALGPGFVNNLALDLVERKMYMTGDLPLGAPGPTGRIWVADLEGGGQDTLMSLWSPPTSIALQPARGKFPAMMYWTDSTSIEQADVNGGGMLMLVEGLPSPGGISLDLAGGKMYWTRNYNDFGLPAVQRANLDGSKVEKLVNDMAGPTTGLALDLAAGKMYWGYVDPNIDGLFAGMIKRSNLDGSDIETIKSGLLAPTGLALDPIGKMLYWADTTLLYRGSLDGVDRDVIATGLSYPGGVAVDPTVPEPGMLWLGLGAIVLARRRRRGY